MVEGARIAGVLHKVAEEKAALQSALADAQATAAHEKCTAEDRSHENKVREVFSKL